MLFKHTVIGHARQCVLHVTKRNIIISSNLHHQPFSFSKYRTIRTMSKRTTPELVIRPEGHLLIDDKLEIKVTGLAKHQRTTLHAVTREGNSEFESCCCYTSDENGEVNLARHPSLLGSYKGGTKHARGVKKQVVRDGKLRGVLYIPAGDGPFPGVIDLFGTAGGIIEFRSALLASRGFASLSLPYFKYEDLTDSLYDLDFEYFMEAIDWMCSHEDVYHDGIGVVGVSKGVDLAYLMAAYSPKISCVVSINGCTFLAAYPMRYKGGILIHHVPAEMDRQYTKDGAFVNKDLFTYTKEDLIPVWRNNAKILNIIGDDDHSSPYENYYFMKEHIPPEKKNNFEIVTYHRAGHVIEPPYSPLTRMSYHKAWDGKFLWGGYPEPHAFAQEDSWRRILKHLNKYIPRTSNCDSHSLSDYSKL